MKMAGKNSLPILKTMSNKSHNTSANRWNDQALIFAALGNKKRLSLVEKLFDGLPHSISQLTQDSKLTRQAVTKHLRILENAQVVISTHAGRETLYQFESQRLEKIKEYLDFVSKQWDQALLRLQSFVEK